MGRGPQWWYDESQNYHYDAPGFLPNYLTFYADDLEGDYSDWVRARGLCWPYAYYGQSWFGYWVCRYYPQGNIINPGYFADNVPPRCVGW